MGSKVSFVRVEEQTAEAVQRSVQAAMAMVEWNIGLQAVSVFLKVNLLSREVMPGQCTSPWVFEGVLQEVRRAFPTAAIYYGDCNVATSRQVDAAVCRWGFSEIGERYGATFVNLSRCSGQEVHVGPIFGRLSIPEILLAVDAILTVPVIKTHCITPFTGALKNQWGLLPRARFKYHPLVHEAIAEINGYFRNTLKAGIADITIAMEGPGPRVGYPKVCDVVMASTDLVALDALVAQYLGFDHEQIRFIQFARDQGLGSVDAEVIGDRFERNPFRPGQGKDFVVYRWRDRFAHIPGIRALLQQEWFFLPLGWIASWYVRHLWYWRVGKPRALQVCASTGYGREFAHLIG